jgi:hypothetical protein
MTNQIIKSRGYRKRSLTVQQLAFVKGLIEGKSSSQAFRDAYPADRSNPANINTSAYRLRRHPQIIKTLKNAEESIAERLIEDARLIKKYVLRQLIALSRTAKQDVSKIKALELLGRSCGFFQPKAEEAEEIDPNKIKADLIKRLSLLNTV